MEKEELIAAIKNQPIYYECKNNFGYYRMEASLDFVGENIHATGITRNECLKKLAWALRNKAEQVANTVLTDNRKQKDKLIFQLCQILMSTQKDIIASLHVRK